MIQCSSILCKNEEDKELIEFQNNRENTRGQRVNPGIWTSADASGNSSLHSWKLKYLSTLNHVSNTLTCTCNATRTTQVHKGQIVWLLQAKVLPVTHIHPWINLDTMSHLCLPLPVTSAGSKRLINMQTHAHVHKHTHYFFYYLSLYHTHASPSVKIDV